MGEIFCEIFCDRSASAVGAWLGVGVWMWLNRGICANRCITSISANTSIILWSVSSYMIRCVPVYRSINRRWRAH